MLLEIKPSRLLLRAVLRFALRAALACVQNVPYILVRLIAEKYYESRNLGDRAGCQQLIAEPILARRGFAADRNPRSEQKRVLYALPADLHPAVKLRVVEVDQKPRERDLFEPSGIGYCRHSFRFRTCRGQT